MSIHSFFEKVFTNWQAKLLSFGAAVLLYASFQIISLDTKAFSVPLQVREGGKFTALEVAPNAVRIIVKGEAKEIAAIQESDIRAYIDTSLVTKPGIAILPIKLDLLDDLALIDPFDVEVSPHTIELLFEENAFAWIPVEPVFKGLIPDGYELLAWKCTPSDIKITGIKSVVDSITAIYADEVDLNDQTESFTVVAGLRVTNSNIRPLAENTVSVHVEIAPQIINRTYANVLPLISSLSPEFSLTKPLTPVSFELSGEKNLLSTYNLKKNALELDFTGITEGGEYSLPLLLNVPNYFEQVSISLAEVVVEIVPAPTPDEKNEVETASSSSELDNPVLFGDVE